MRVLVVEDDEVDQLSLRRVIDREGLPYDLAIVATVAEARRLLATREFDVLVTDYRLPDGSAFDVAKAAHGLPWIIVTGDGDEGVAVAALRAGAHDYLVKAADLSHLKILSFSIESATRLAEAEARNRMLSLAITSIQEAVYITDADNRITFVNPAFEMLYGYSAAEVLDMTEWALWTEDDALGGPGRTRPTNGEWSGEVVHVRNDGTEIPVWICQSVLTDSSGDVMATVCVVRDITERRRLEVTLKRANQELERSRQALLELASRDDLTGLLNRRELTRLFVEEVARARRSNKPISLILIDIDHFKRINDQHGHPAGDEVLKHLAALFGRTLRVVDRVARIGGEEFAILLPETDLDGAAVLADRLRRLVAMDPCPVVDGAGVHREVAVTISAGVAIRTKPSGSLPELLASADRGLYRAKADGRNRIVRADEVLE